MTSAPLLPGRRRMMALCAVSLLLHVAVLAWIARRAPRLPPAGGDGGALVLRVRVADLPPGASAASPPAAASRAPGGTPARSQVQPVATAPSPSAQADGTAATPSPADAAAAASDAPVTAPGGSPALPSEQLFGAPQEPLESAPQRYRVRLPPPVLVDYAVVHSDPGAPPQPADSARLTWHYADGAYRMQLDGAPTADGRRALASTGMIIDRGMAPRDADTGEPRPAQDEASMLMLLTGMGMQDPGQLENDVRILVDADGVLAVLRFKPIGTERIASAIGPIDTLRLAQVSGPGAARLEVWLAPAHKWLPVQLRDTWPDGSVTTRLVSRIGVPAD